MGIKSASDIFQSCMVGVFQLMTVGKPKPYIDDIFHGKGNTFKEHLIILDKIFQCLLDAGMQVNLDKCTLYLKSVKFLGFNLGQKRIPTYKEAYQNHPQSSTAHESQEDVCFSWNHQFHQAPCTQSCSNYGTHHMTHQEGNVICLETRTEGVVKCNTSSSC